MTRLLIFTLIVLGLGLGFAWFADRPGEVFLTWQGNEYRTSLMVVLTAIVALVAAIMFVWWVIRTILDSPRIMRRFFRNRRRDRGYMALSQGLIAAGSGDAASARRFAKESVKLLGHEPLVELLDAQTSLIEGRRDEAKARFESMLSDDKTRLVALRGLYLEAEKQGAREAARHYAEEAHKASAALPWAANAMLRYRTLEGDWEGALAALEASKSAGVLDKETARRQRAVILTALAAREEAANPSAAARHAKEAHKLAPDFVPAAVIGAQALVRNNEIARAAGALESVWKREPHPEIANAYVHLRAGDSAQDRLKRARKLAGMRPNHPEGNIAIAEAAIEAQDWQAARDAMKPVVAGHLTERACLIMADIEEGEHGDRGRMRDWLSRAVRAPKDAAWTADGMVSERWLPISPATGRIDAFEWKVPVAQLGGPAAMTVDPAEADAIREPSGPVSGPVTVAAQVATGTVAAATAAEAAEGIAGDIAGDVSGDGVRKSDGDIIDVVAEPVDTAGLEARPAGRGSAPESGKAPEKIAPKSGDGGASPAGPSGGTGEVRSRQQEDEGGDVPFPLSRRPDDPGVDGAEPDEAERKKLFGLF